MFRVPMPFQFFVVVVGFGITVWTSARGLPPLVATRFALDGSVTGFLPREHYRLLMTLLVVLVPACAAWLPIVAAGADGGHLDIPARAHWLDPSRRRDTLVWWRDFCCGSGAGLAAFLCGLHGIVLIANLSHPPALSWVATLALFASFGVALVVMLTTLGRRFRRPPSEGPRAPSDDATRAPAHPSANDR